MGTSYYLLFMYLWMYVFKEREGVGNKQALSSTSLTMGISMEKSEEKTIKLYLFLVGEA